MKKSKIDRIQQVINPEVKSKFLAEEKRIGNVDLMFHGCRDIETR